MNRNIELKARVPDLAAVRTRLATLHCHGDHVLGQTDTFFVVQRGRLKLREFDDGTGELIFYERPDQAGAKLSLYDRIPCTDPTTLLHALSNALGVRGIVKKRPHVFLIGHTRVHLDEIDGLGSFMELEVVLQPSESIADGETTAADILRALHIPEADLIRGAYIDLLEARRPCEDR